MYGESDDYPFRDASEQEKLLVWKLAAPIGGHDENIYRADACGKTIRFMDHGTHGNYGWYIDCITPLSRGGTMDVYNLQPLHWRNRLIKRSYLFWFPQLGISD